MWSQYDIANYTRFHWKPPSVRTYSYNQDHVIDGKGCVNMSSHIVAIAIAMLHGYLISVTLNSIHYA